MGTLERAGCESERGGGKNGPESGHQVNFNWENVVKNLDVSGLIAPYYRDQPMQSEEWYVRKWVDEKRRAAAQLGLRIIGASLMPKEPRDILCRQRRVLLHCTPISN